MNLKNNLVLLLISGLLLNYACTTTDMVIDKSNLDTNTQPGNDFYQYANGGWLKTNPLPAEFSRYGSFDKLAEDNQKIVKQLIEEASSVEGIDDPIKRKIGNFYSAGMDTARIESEGLRPIEKELQSVRELKDNKDIIDLIAEWHRSGNQVLFHFYGAPDQKNSEMVIANIDQGGLGLPDVDYYTSDDPKSKEIREKYLKVYYSTP